MACFQIFVVSEIRMVLFRLFFFVLLLQQILWSQNVFIKTDHSSFYSWITQQFNQKGFKNLPLFSDNFLQKIPLQRFNLQEGIFLRIAESALLPEQDFKAFLYQKEINIQTKELYLIQPSFLEKSSPVNLDHRIFLLFLPLLEDQYKQDTSVKAVVSNSFESANLHNNEFLVYILDNWKNFNKNNNSVLLLVYDFSLLTNIYQTQFFSDVLKLGDDLSEDLGGDVLLVDHKFIEPIFLKKGIFIKDLFKKTPVVKIDIPVEFKSQPLLDTVAYNIVAYLPAAVKTDEYLIISTHHDDQVLSMLDHNYSSSILPNALRHWINLAFSVSDFWKGKKNNAITKIIRKKNVIFISFAGKNQGDYGFYYYLNHLKKATWKPWLQIHFEDQLCGSSPTLHANISDLEALHPYLQILKKEPNFTVSDEICLQNIILSQSIVPVVFYPITSAATFDEKLQKIIFMNVINLITE